MYFNEIYNEVEQSHQEKEKIARQNKHDALISKQMEVKNGERFVVSMGSIFPYKRNGGNYEVCKLEN